MKYRELRDLLKEDLNHHKGGGRKIIALLFDPRLRLLRWCRWMFYLKSTRLSFLNIIISHFVLFCYSSQVSINAKIGRRFKFAHPLGIVIGDGAVIGDDCVVFQNVTLGAKGGRKDEPIKEYPVIKNAVRIYPNSVVAGGVVIGEGAIIGACSLVIQDVEPNSIVGGVPAKKIG